MIYKEPKYIKIKFLKVKFVECSKKFQTLLEEIRRHISRTGN